MNNDKRLPPRNEEAERIVLGSMLSSREAIDTVTQILSTEDFSNNAHKIIFSTILELDKKNHTADILTVIEELGRIKQLEKAGGNSYIAALTNILSSSANIEYYAQIVLDRSVRRTLLNIINCAFADIFDDSIDYRLLVDKIEKQIFELKLNKQSYGYKNLKDIVPKVIKEIDNRVKAKNAVTGIPSGFLLLDEMTSGFQRSDYIVIGARPSVGKTALVLSMALHISAKKNIPAAFFSLEMSDMSLVMRMLAGESRVDHRKIKTGLLKSSDYSELLEAAETLYDMPLYIIDTPNMRIQDLRTQARRLRSREKVEIIFIDYMTLVTPENSKQQTYDQYNEVSKNLKSLARDLEIPIIVLSQLGRKTHTNNPNLSDIRAAGGIEQDADLVIFLIREKGATTAKLRIEKQRNGETGDVEIAFLPQYMKFENLSREK